MHAVPARRFVLVAAQHPLITVRRLTPYMITSAPTSLAAFVFALCLQAIQENAGALQTADITQMPEQCVSMPRTRACR